MSLEDKIRSAFRRNNVVSTTNNSTDNTNDKMLKESIPSKWDPDTQPNLYELGNFLRKSGYRLIDIVISKSSVPELLIEPIEEGPLHPNISHDISDGRFYIQVLEHGMLESSDLEYIMTGYQNALSVVKYLEDIDLDDLEINREE